MRDEDDRPTLAMRASSGVDDADEDTSTSTTPEQVAPGTDIGGYTVDGELGRGGMGVVYSATHPLIGKRAAIKVLAPELSKDPIAVERFVLEARAVNQIGHPNIVDIFAFGTLPDGRSYYVMDLLTGESLRARMKRGPLHVSEAASLIEETASALIAAHAKGIMHRDLKPDNLYMASVPGRWPEVKILDWGLAKLISSSSAPFQRTLTGSVMGTPVYMSPEQARSSDSVDYRTDIYSLGVMSYELLTGVVPFDKQSSIDTLVAHQEDPVPPLLAKVPTLPEDLAQLIEAMLAKDPADRPTLTAVVAVLKRLRGTKIPTMTAAGLPMIPLPPSPAQWPAGPLPAAPPGPPPVHDDSPSLELTVPRAQALGPVVKMFEPGVVPRTIPGTPGSMPVGSIPPAVQPRASYPPQTSYPAAAGLLPPEPKTLDQPPPPSRRGLVFALVAAIAIVIGLIVLIAH